MIEFSVKPSTVPIPFHKLLKVALYRSSFGEPE
jgi:hypothetical protein